MNVHPNGAPIISADSHVLEPGDLWTRTLGSRFGDALPRIVNGFEGHDGTFFYLGRPGEAARIDELVNAVGDDERVRELVRAGADPMFRLQLMKKDGVSAEVLNPTFALWVPRIPDPAMRRACAQLFNDWIVEYSQADRTRLLGVGIVPIDDPRWAAEEATRIVHRGARGIMLPTQPIEGAPPYRGDVYDPFWAVAQEAGVPITLHIVTGRVRDPFTYHGADERGEVPRSFLELFGEAAPVLANEFIFGGVFDRFPKLSLFLSEYDASWLPILKYRVDRIETFPGLTPLRKRAREYIEQNVYAGIINDPLAAKLRHEIGVGRILWGSDFPHPPCPYPHTRKRIGEILAGIPDDEREAMTSGNVCRLYRIDASALVE
ncbi:MAG TPA: amidohydrolase family protein [Casimicrobiaceae bacterium]|nr:amidohydrolase family protein [Casimicrobiaceae bacterium]